MFELKARTMDKVRAQPAATSRGGLCSWCYERCDGSSSHPKTDQQAIGKRTRANKTSPHAGLVAGKKAQLPVDRPHICFRALAGSVLEVLCALLCPSVANPTVYFSSEACFVRSSSHPGGFRSS